MRPICLIFLFLHLAFAQLDFTYTGDPVVGGQLQLSWDGVQPYSLDIQTATSTQATWQEYRSWPSLDASFAVWNVDVSVNTYVQFTVTDSTGATGSDVALITGPMGNVTMTSISSVSVASTQSIESIASVISVVASSMASVSSGSSASSTMSVTYLTTVSTPTPTSTPSRSSVITPKTSTSSAAGTGTALPSSQGHSKGTQAGPIIGAILGVLIAIGIALFILRKIFLRRRRSQIRAQMYDYGPRHGPDMAENGLRPAPLARRRTLTKERPNTINWNPDSPHLTPNVAAFTSDNLFPAPEAAQQMDATRPAEALRRFSGYVTERWSPTTAAHQTNNNVEMMQPQPQPQTSVMANVTPDQGRARKSVPLALNETIPSAQPLAPNWEAAVGAPRKSEEHHVVTPTRQSDSPFADKFSVKGMYVPDLSEPTVPDAPKPPRPPRPTRPVDLALDAAATAAPPNVAEVTRQHRLSMTSSNPGPGPVPTVGHSRKISAPIPIMMATSPNSTAGMPTEGGGSLPLGALLMRDDSRYPTLPSTASPPSHTSALSNVVTSPNGRQIFPMAPNKPSQPRHPSLRQGTTTTTNNNNNNNTARPLLHQRHPSNGFANIAFPTSLPAAQGPIYTATAITPSIPQRRVPPPNTISPPQYHHQPLSPPQPAYRRGLGEQPDVPSTPTSDFPPSPPKSSSGASISSTSTAQIVTVSNQGHSRKPSEVDLDEAYGGIALAMTTVPTSRTPSPNLLKRPPPIETSHPYASSSAMLTPITDSPNYQQGTPVEAPLPSAIPSSRLGSPMAPSPSPPAPVSAPTPLGRSSSAATASSAVRREILQSVRQGAAIRAGQKGQTGYSSAQSPTTPAFFPDRITNYHATPAESSLSSAPTNTASPLTAAGRERDSSLFDGASKHMSANSARRLSDITAGDAEWRELQKQLKWEHQ